MDRWEYFQTSIPLELTRRKSQVERAQQEFYGRLDSLGAEGWEMVGFQAEQFGDAMWFLCMFKRRKAG